MTTTILDRIKEVLATTECNHDDFSNVMEYCASLRTALEVSPPDTLQAKFALNSIAVALDGRTGTKLLVDEIDSILEELNAAHSSQPNELKVPPGYHVYRTLVGTWRWSRGTFGTADFVDGENLPAKVDAIQDAIEDAQKRESLPK